MTINAEAAQAPDDDEPPDATSWFTRVAPRPGIALEPGLSLAVAPEATPDDPPQERIATDIDSPLLALTTAAAAETPTAQPATPVDDRSRLGLLPFTGAGLTGLGGVLLGCLVVGLGAASDLASGGGLGTVFIVAFLLGSAAVASVVRIRSLATAVVLPPLLFAGGYGLETKTSGQTTGQRQMALDVATSLALHAPMLFIGTAVAVAVALVRLVVHLIRR